MKKCGICKQIKSPEDFFFRNKEKGTRQSWCKKCALEHKKVWYVENKERLSKLAFKWKVKNRKEVHDKYWEYLKSHPCVDCGNDNPIVLEGDHLRDKKYSLTNLIREGGVTWPTILKELEKCQVRCANCHRIKTHRENNSWRYQKYRFFTQKGRR